MRSKRRIIFFLLLASVTALVVIFEPHDSGMFLNNKSSPPIYLPLQCATIAISQSQFTQAVKDVVLHGDLRDIPFIEKTFDTKFKYQYRMYGGAKDQHNYYARADSIFGTRLISITVTVYDNDDNNRRDAVVASLDILGYPGVLSECLGFDGNDINRFLIDAAKSTPPDVAYATQGGELMILDMGENKAVNKLQYEFGTPDPMPNGAGSLLSRIDGLTVKQLSKASQFDSNGIAAALFDRKGTDVDSSLQACLAHILRDASGNPVQQNVHDCMNAMGYEVLHGDIKTVCGALLRADFEDRSKYKQEMTACTSKEGEKYETISTKVGPPTVIFN